MLLKLHQFVDVDERGEPIPESSKSTAKVFKVSPNLEKYLQDYEWVPDHGAPIAEHLHPDLFYYKRKISEHEEGHDHLEANLINIMPYIVSSQWPCLTAAQANTQIEFDRTFRTIAQEPAYEGKKVLFVSGLNVDISPQKGQLFPLTKFIPWAAYVQDENGNQQTWEQGELFEKLKAQPITNDDQVDLESAIEIMHSTKEIHLPF